MLVWSVATALAWLVGLIGPTVLNPERFPAFATPLFCGVYGVFLASVRTNGIRCGLLLLIIGFWCASIVIQQGRQTWSAHEVVTPELARLAPQALFVSDEFLSEGFAQHGPEVDPPLDPAVLRPIWGKIPGPLAQWRAFAALDPDQPVAIVLHHRPFSGEDPNRPLFNLLQLVSREPCFLPEHNTIRSHAAHRLGPIRSVVPEWWSEFPIPPRERVAWPDPPLHEAFPPDDVLGCVRGFSDRRFFHGLGKDGRRWSRPCGWLDFPGWQAGQRFDHLTTITLLVEYPPRLTPDYSPDLILRTFRLNRPDIYVDTPGVEWTSSPLTFSCPVPSGTGAIRIAWNMNGVNPAKMSNSNDDRDLGLHFQAVGLNYSAPATEWWQGR
jgi:hypothetical protein